MEFERIAILTAISLPPTVAIVNFARLTWGTEDSRAEASWRSWLLTSVFGAIAGLVCVALILAPPFDMVARTIALRPLLEEGLGAIVPFVIAIALGLLICSGVRRTSGYILRVFLVVTPLLSAAPILTIQHVYSPDGFYQGHPQSVSVTNSASATRVVSGLNHSGSITNDSNGRLILTEWRTGKLVLLEPRGNGSFDKRVLAQIPLPIGLQMEQGLWHAVLDREQRYLYVSGIESVDLEEPRRSTSKVVRFPYDDGELGSMEVLVSKLPAGKAHSGGALAFGPDDNLYVSVGDAELLVVPPQDNVPLGIRGSIFRLTPDGAIPEDTDNPWSPVYAFGFRNPYGMAFHPENGTLFVTDNGPDCCDRIVRVEPGQFHGWPLYGDHPQDLILLKSDPTTVRGIDPAVVHGIYDTGWAHIGPTQLIFYDGERYGDEFRGNLFYGTFGTKAIHRVVLSNNERDVVKEEIVWESKQPIIGLTGTDDGYIYFVTTTEVFRIDGFHGQD